MAALLEIRKLGKRFAQRQGREPSPWVIQDLSFSVRDGRVPHHRRPLGRRQVDAAQHHRADRHRERRRDRVRRHDGHAARDPRALKPGIDRRIGYVTQDDNLLPWRITLDNVLFALEVQGRLNDETRARAEMLIRAVGLAGFEHYYPHELSGGMRKRTALIRTLVYDPPVILMDEPFAAVDAQTRTQLQADLLKLWEPRAQDHHLRHPRHHRGDCARRPRAGAEQAALAHRGRAHDPDPAAAQREGHLRASQASRRRTRKSGRTCNDRRARLEAPAEASAVSRKAAVYGGRLALAAALILAWEYGARTLGPLFFAPPLDVLERIGDARHERPDVHRHRGDAARLGGGLRHRGGLRRAAAVPAAALAARDRGDRALHHGLDGHSRNTRSRPG